ncbi:MAG: thiamine pyrophosphate-binding protein [Vicinamibacterales bacterium]
MKPKRTSAAKALVDILERERVEVVFGVPGGPVLPLYDALSAHPAIRLVLTRHEQAAAYSAFAYARVSGRLGVCVATLGPGATNLLAGLPVAYASACPVLALTGQVQTTGFARSAHQESTGWFRTPDQERMFAGTCKHTATCMDASRFPDFVRHSIRIAYAGRPGPAHLILPANLLHQQVAYVPLEPRQYRLVDHQPCDERAVEEIAHRLAAARFPIVLCGERATMPDTGAEVTQLSERHAIPVATDLAAKSVVDELSPLYLGCVGVLAHRAAEQYIKHHADVVLAVGQTFNEISTLSWDPAFAEGRDLIQIDMDPEEIGKVYPAASGTAGHLPAILRRLAEHLDRLTMADGQERRRVVSELRARYPLFDAPEMRSDKVPLLPQRVAAELRGAVPERALVLSDSSKWNRWLARFFPSRRGDFVTAHDYEPMGWAVAGAIGASFAVGDRPVVCVSGDGAFMMNGLEVATAVQYRRNVTWVVMNDSRFGIIYDLQKGLYGGRTSCSEYRNPDLVQFGASCGARARRIETPGALSTHLGEAIAAGGPAVLDVRFDADEIPPVRPRSLLITRAMGLPDPTPGPEVTRAMIKLLRDR